VILHVAVTLSAARLASGAAFDRIAPALPVNRMVVLPPVTPQTQPLPFLAPDVRVAVCLFKTRNGVVNVAAALPAPGWTLTLYANDGTSIYSAAAVPDRRTDISLQLVPDDNRFLGLTPEARGQRSPDRPVQRVQASNGLIVIRAPDLGYAYRAQTDAELKRATCRASQLAG
jgi:uncharacterized membrane protein